MRRPRVEQRPAQRRRRGLVLAGGGQKVAYQAGVLEILLPALETGGQPTFEQVQATSGGVLNAALMCQYQDGRRIADAWRRLRPLRALSINWSSLLPMLVGKGTSLLEWRRFKKNVLHRRPPRGWGLDFTAINARDAGSHYYFNAYNFSQHRLESVHQRELDETKLLACASLPGWYPSQKVNNDVWVDAVFATDSNASALLQYDLDEIWVIWTIDVSGRWRNGFIPHYFQIIEQAASYAYRREREVLLRNGFKTPDGRARRGSRHAAAGAVRDRR